ncbi:MAG: hypothetical protein R3Y50_06570 [Rikenellaceae bacterium]
MRKFLSKLLLFSSIILTVIGCQKDELASQILDGTSTILRATVDVAADTKMSFTDNSNIINIAWEVDDEFTLYDAEGALLGNLKCISVDNSGVGEFAITQSLSTGANYTAIYPASTAETLDAAKTEKIDYLLEQDGSKIDNLSDACYMLSEFSYSQNGSISFTHQLSVMTFTFTPTAAITKLDFKDGENDTYVVKNLSCEANEEYTTYIMINPTKSEDINEDKATERTLSFTLYNGEDICSSYATQSTVAFIAGYNYTSPFSTLDGIDLSSNVGTAENPIKISTAQELYAIMSLINNYPEDYSDLYYEVSADIDLSKTDLKSVTKTSETTISTNFTPIGSEAYPFKGVFNGNGHTISGLSITCDDAFAGFFGYTDGAIIKNLTINGTISSSATDSSVGGIVAIAQNETLIINCSSNVTVSGGNAGGIVGTITDSSVVNSFNEGVVDGSSNSGGIVGATGESATNTSTEIINCVNKAEVTGSNSGAISGGGTTENDITVTDCYYDEEKYTKDSSSNVGEVTGKTTEYIESDTFINELNNNVIDYNDSVGSGGETAAGWVDSDENFGSASNNDAPIEKVLDIELSDGIYIIKTANGLKAFADLINGSENSANALYSGDGFATFGKANQSINGKLTNNIDLSTICGASINDVEVNWTPILDYTGTFDGDYHEVSGLYINTGSSKSALFGSIYGATVKNIGVDGSVYGGSHTAGLVGYCTSNSTVQNCYNKASVTVYITNIGSVGGVIGQIDGSNLIINSYNAGYIDSTVDYSGSLVGRAFESGGKIINCYNLANVYSGGLVGLSSPTVAIPTVITNCYNVGKNNSGNYCAISTSTNSYYASDTSGQTSGGATSMTLEEMTSENFVNILNNGVYEYNSSSPTIEACVWKAGDDGYPTFDYENTDATYTYFTAGGQGTESEPYQISTADGINDLSEFVASGESTSGLYFELTSDIDLGGIDSYGNGIDENEFTAIGDSDIRFKGTFDGGGYEISGLYINKSDVNNQGLFGVIDGATIKNLGVSGIITGNKFTGAIAGEIYNSKVIGCYNKATITGSGDVGGLVGCMYSGSRITGCYNVGDVDNLADDTVSGGIAGAAVYTCYITACYSTGKISATSGAGGILGKDYQSTTTVSSCYWIAATDGDATYGIANNSSNSNATKLDDIIYFFSSEGDPCPAETMNIAAESETGVNATFVAGAVIDTDTPKLWYE